MVLQILDVRKNVDAPGSTEHELLRLIDEGLSATSGSKTLPTMLLYDTRGLRLYDEITTNAEEYYLFEAERQILRDYAKDIVQAQHIYEGGKISSDEVVLELGAGSLRKTSLILEALSDLPTASTRPLPYYALDLDRNELERTLIELHKSTTGSIVDGKVDVKGMHATYDEGLEHVKQGGLDREARAQRMEPSAKRNVSPASSSTSEAADSTGSGSSAYTAPSTPEVPTGPLHLLFLGSSLGNFNRLEAVQFLRSLPLTAGSDTLLLGLDHENEPAVIHKAYNDSKGFTKNFIMNGLRRANETLKNSRAFDDDKWEYIGKYNDHKRCHEAFVKSLVDQTIVNHVLDKSYHISNGELLQIESSYKYSTEASYRLFDDAGLRVIRRWTDNSDRYSLWLLERPPFALPTLRQVSSKEELFNIPSVDDWKRVWDLWDFITLRMIPTSMLFQKPIDLRHICLFYIGHIPTFLDIHLTRLLGGKHTEPENFKDIFERGIDPNVDDPNDIHPHSEVPTSDSDWPTLKSILDFRSRVRERLLQLYNELASGITKPTQKIARVLFMTMEHEALHAETLLYMLLQRAGTGTIPPPGFATPEWSSLALEWNKRFSEGTGTVTLGPETVVVGHNDPESADYIGEKDQDLDDQHAFGWDNESPQRSVTVQPFRIEWHPVTNAEFFAFMEAEGKGQVQVPTGWIEVEGEMCVRTFHGPVSLDKIARNWPVCTNYEDLSRYAQVKGGRLPTETELRLFMDKFYCGYEGGANVGFRNWHPVPATGGGSRQEKGHNGGIWEWTSTALAKHDGYEQSALYPGYSADFFDGRHQIVIGGSYATIPRISERRTFVNWYQSKYGYAWTGARVVYDVLE